MNIFRRKPKLKEGNDIPVQLLNWRKNMWVMTPGGIGILTEVNTFSKVHLIALDGSTVQEMVYNITLLRQAYLSEIPKSRLNISKEKAAILGYK